MFAGPNGSGKSTIKKIVPEKLLGFYINPDELEIEIKQTRRHGQFPRYRPGGAPSSLLNIAMNALGLL